MLREVGNVRQQDPLLRRRWFCDDYFDLFIWEKAANGSSIVGFQLCYDKFRHERVLYWRESAGYTHHGVDSGDRMSGANMTPILVADGVLPLPAVLAKFDVSATGVESGLRDFIRGRLLDYGTHLDKAKADG